MSGAFHVADRGMTEATDLDIWHLCAGQDWILVSKDRDFADLHSRRLRPGAPGPKVVWVRLGICCRLPLLAAFRRAWPAILKSFRDGEELVELR